MVVESVRDFVSDDPADAAVVHVGRTILAEENALSAHGGNRKNKKTKEKKMRMICK